MKGKKEHGSTTCERCGDSPCAEVRAKGVVATLCAFCRKGFETLAADSEIGPQNLRLFVLPIPLNFHSGPLALVPPRGGG